jgi:molybdate transport system ATP-binding protein
VWGVEVAEAAGLTVSLHQSWAIPLAIEFACAPGELIALVGPSGAGKTTVLRSIAGLYRPAAANIRCGGLVWADTDAKIWRPPHLRRVGLVFQSYALFPHLTALANVEAALNEKPPGDRRSEARALLDRVDLGDVAFRKPDQLSGGQQQRVALARAMAREPHALLLDEPLSAVDRRTRRKLREIIVSIRSAAQTPIILVTHDLGEAMELADRLIVIDRGETLQIGEPSQVLAEPASERVRDALDFSTDTPNAATNNKGTFGL